MSDFTAVQLLNQLTPVIITGGYVPRGAYAAGTDYAVGDSVDYNGSSYVMFVDAAAGTLPTDTTKWQVLANKGDTGADSTVPGPSGVVDNTSGINFQEIATPANPSASYLKVYAKSDDKVYKLTSGGVESEIGAGGAQTPWTSDINAAGYKLIGNTTTTGDLTLQTTSGVGTTGADMHFLVGNNGATEAMTILNSGNVGIGTTAPVDKLEVSDGTYSLGFTPGTGGRTNYRVTGISVASIYYDASSANVSQRGLWIAEDYPAAGTTRGLHLASGGSERVTILGTGNVGIGTTGPTNILSLGGNSARTFWLERHTTANTAGNTLTVTAGGATSGATDKAGGDLILTPGLSTGTGESGVQIKGVPAGSTGTTDGTQTLMIQVLGNKFGVFANTPVVKQTGIAALKVDYTAGDLDTEAEIITALNTTNTAINALRTALNNYGFTTVV